MTSYLWILLFGVLVIPKVQNFDLEDALGEETPPPPTVKPPKVDDGGGFNLEDAIGTDPKNPNTDPKPPVVPPNSGDSNPPQSGGDFSDQDLFDNTKGGGSPDASQGNGYEDAQNDQPKAAEGGQMAGIISAVAVAIFGAASSYFAYQKKKLCFKMQGGTDPESGRNQSGTQSDPQTYSNLLRSS